MTKLIIIIIFIFLLPCQAYAIKPGVYFCYTENLVGIQKSKKFPENLAQEKMWDWMRNNRKGSVLKPIIKKFVIKVKKLGVKSYELELPKKKIGQLAKRNILQSSDSYMFKEHYTTFFISDPLHYVIAKINGIFGNYLEEGQCEIFDE